MAGAGRVCGLVMWCLMASLNGLAATDSAGYSYQDAIGKAILFFEGQRSGKLPTNQRVKWRGDSALSDGQPENVFVIALNYNQLISTVNYTY